MTGSWDIAGSIEDDRVSVLSTRDDEMYRIYDLQALSMVYESLTVFCLLKAGYLTEAVLSYSRVAHLHRRSRLWVADSL